MKDVFISYAHEDRDAAKALADRLDEAGLSVWWDPQLRAGQRFAAVIEETLQQVRCVIVLWSRHSVSSDWVNAEANEGMQLGKLLPVALDGAAPPLIFRALHTLELSPADLHTGAARLNKLIADVRVRIGGNAKTSFTKRRFAWPSIGVAALVITVIVGLALSGWAARLVDRVTLVVGGSPLALRPLLTEALVAIAGVGILLIAWRRIWHGPARTLGLAAGLLLLGTQGSVWVDRFSRGTPDHLFGRIVASDWQRMEVTALDAAGASVALQAVPVDSENGGFGLRLEPVFADRPSWLLVEKPGCASQRQTISWADWRESNDIEVEFRCQ